MGARSKILRFFIDEPVFKPEDVSTEEQQSVANVSLNTEVSDVVPLVRLENVESMVSEDHLDVYGHAHNESEGDVLLSEIRLLDMSRRLGEKLSGGETKRLLLYVGPKQRKIMSDEAVLQYASESGRYSAHYKILTASDNGADIITSLELQLPIHEA